MLVTMFVMAMTLVTTVIVRLIKLAGSFKNILSTMITRNRTKDFVILHPILQSVGRSVGQTEYLVRKSAQLYYECDEINLHMGSMFSSSESELQFFQTYLHRCHQKDFTN